MFPHISTSLMFSYHQDIVNIYVSRVAAIFMKTSDFKPLSLPTFHQSCSTVIHLTNYLRRHQVLADQRQSRAGLHRMLLGKKISQSTVINRPCNRQCCERCNLVSGWKGTSTLKKILWHPWGILNTPISGISWEKRCGGSANRRRARSFNENRLLLTSIGG